MGDPMWRLATAINYVAQHIESLQKQQQVEIVVADWGSEIPIADVIQLTEQACAITRFIQVPADLAMNLQQDSAFGEVFALNAAARRSKGQYIGRIDQDTLVTKDFLVCFFDALDGKRNDGFDLSNTYMFAARKQLSFSFVSKQPSIQDLELSIAHMATFTFNEELTFCHWASPVGILLMHRNIWYDIGGYDERLIYYWFMDVDLATRLINKYPVVNIGKVFGYHFFHLEHVRSQFKFRHSHRKLNPAWSKSFNKPVLNPNGKDWGLGKVELLEKTAKSIDFEEQFLELKVLVSKIAWLSLFAQTCLMSLKGWTLSQIRWLFYLSKKLRQKPYL
jgi:GT2 family glycosyltransferase